MLKILVSLIMGSLIVGCGISDLVGIDYYKVGDKVLVRGINKDCSTVIVEYIPLSQYIVKIKCKVTPTMPWPNLKIHESDIIGRVT